jgi:hypothetical protein
MDIILYASQLQHNAQARTLHTVRPWDIGTCIERGSARLRVGGKGRKQKGQGRSFVFLFLFFSCASFKPCVLNSNWMSGYLFFFFYFCSFYFSSCCSYWAICPSGWFIFFCQLMLLFVYSALCLCAAELLSSWVEWCTLGTQARTKNKGLFSVPTNLLFCVRVLFLQPCPRTLVPFLCSLSISMSSGRFIHSNSFRYSNYRHCLEDLWSTNPEQQ